MPPRTKSPGRAKSPAAAQVAKSPVIRASSRVTRRSADAGAKAEIEATYKAATSDPTDGGDSLSSGDFKRSVLIYLSCVASLGVAFTALVFYAPPAPAGGMCDGVTSDLLFNLIPRGIPGSREQDAIITVWRCTTAYQASNWWFVLFFFELVFLGLKMFALPVSFALSILSGAIFPFPLSQALVSMGETFGSTLCYLLSSAIAKPVLEFLAPQKLLALRKRADEERDNMFLFNIFLRLSPFPNWLINASSPAVGNPLPHFFFGTLCGTFFPTLLLSRCGWVLRTVGEKGFDLAQITKDNFPYMVAVGLSQFVPVYIIRYKKQQKVEAKAAAKTVKALGKSK